MENVGRTLVSSVLFLDIVEYSQMSVSEQLGVKQRFNESLKVALDPVAARDRVVLDTSSATRRTPCSRQWRFATPPASCRCALASISVRCA
jgi:hypothetical protein